MRGTNKLKAKLNAGEAAIGLPMQIPSPVTVEIACLAGFDFVIMDTEHGPFGIETAEPMIRTADLAGVTPLVRVTENNPSLIMKALDAGAHGVVVPQVTTRAAAEQAVQAAKFAPRGFRGACPLVRASAYTAMEDAEFYRRANEETIVIQLIEGAEGIANFKEIIEVEGLDVAYLGPVDLALSLGVHGDTYHPLVIEKLEESVEVARRRGIAVGIYLLNPEDAPLWISKGVRFIATSCDTKAFYQACQSVLQRARPAGALNRV